MIRIAFEKFHPGCCLEVVEAQQSTQVRDFKALLGNQSHSFTSCEMSQKRHLAKDYTAFLQVSKIYIEMESWPEAVKIYWDILL